MRLLSERLKGREGSGICFFSCGLAVFIDISTALKGSDDIRVLTVFSSSDKQATEYLSELGLSGLT
jgi:hypothetical protein